MAVKNLTCSAFEVLLKLMNVTELKQQTEMKEAYKFGEEIRLQSVCPLYTEGILCSYCNSTGLTIYTI